MEGPEVAAMQERLTAIHYDVGPIDGVYGGGTHHAVMAFQKVEGLKRTGQATTETLSRLATAAPPAPLVPGGGAMRVEVDLPRQVVLLYKGDTIHSIYNSSTGNDKRYCVDGRCAVAVTPGGSFRVTRKINGLRVSRLGQLYNPLYFNGGIAIHGSPSVPAYPASHGCVRIPLAASKGFHDEVPRGTPVYVVGGRNAPVPFGEEAPPEETTTTAPPETTTTVPPEETTTTSTTTTTTTTTTATTVVPTTSSTTTTTSPPPP
jgi:peptidoglycan hydrolase-like protein with peptidoglycan-binding domain